MAIWMPINEAAQTLGIHPRTLRRHVNNGKRKSRMEDGKRVVLLEEDEVANGNANDTVNGSDNDNAYGNDQMALIAEKNTRIEALQCQLKTLENALSDLQERFDFLQNEASESRTRSDTIIMQLTKQVEKQTFLLEDMRDRSVWSRFKGAFKFRNRRVSNAEYSS